MPLPQVPLDDAEKDWRNKPINYGFSEDYPVFWGPQQLTVYPDTYMNPIGFRDKTILTPSVVFRGFGGGKAASPPPPPPPPPNANSLCVTGSGNGFVLIGFRFGRTAFYHTGLSDHRCCPNPTDVPYRYLYSTTITQSGSFTFNGSSTTATALLDSLIRLEPHSKMSWMNLMNKDYIGETGRTVTQISCGTFAQPFCTYNQAKLEVNAGTDLGPGTATYSNPLDLPWAYDPWTQIEQKWFPGGPAMGGDGKFTIYYFINCVGFFLPQVCAAVLGGWNAEPDRSQLNDCGRLTPAY